MTNWDKLRNLAVEDGCIDKIEVSSESVSVFITDWQESKVQILFHSVLYVEVMPFTQGTDIDRVEVHDLGSDFMWILQEAYSNDKLRNEESALLSVVRIHVNYGKYPALTLIAETADIFK